MSIGDNIKHLRKTHNLSQEEFGKIAGVSDKAVSTWETGTKVPRMGAIQKIADYFNIAKSDIIEDKPSDDISEDLVILNRNAKKLSPENRKKLLDIAKVMFKEEFND